MAPELGHERRNMGEPCDHTRQEKQERKAKIQFGGNKREGPSVQDRKSNVEGPLEQDKRKKRGKRGRRERTTYNDKRSTRERAKLQGQERRAK